MEPHSTRPSKEDFPEDFSELSEKSPGSPSPDSLDSALLERYWLGDATRQESDIVDAWLVANPVWKARYSDLKEHLQTDTKRDWAPLTPIEVHNSIDKVLTATGLKNSVPGAVPVRRSSRTGWNISRPLASIGLAAVCMMAVGLGWLFSTSRTAPAAEQSYTTGVGQRITVTLADGTTVTLAPKSVINIPDDFGTATRTVALNGEAYFDVTTADRSPFIVKTENTNTWVLGTRFVVKHYDSNPNVWVAVESGKVSVTRENTESAILTPGQVALYDGVGLSVAANDDLSDYTDWLHSRLTFRSSPLDEALETLTRWYGVNFNVSDPKLMEFRITGSLPYGSLEDMLKTLRDLLNVSLSYERREDGTLTVTLHSTVNEPRPLRRENRFSLPTAFNR